MKTSARICVGSILAAALLGLLLYLWASHKTEFKPALGERHGQGAVSAADSRLHTPTDAALHSTTPAKGFLVADDGTVVVPSRYQLPGVARVRSTAANFDDWLKQYPPGDRARIKDFDTRYNGVYEVASPQQIAWMAQNGYPMPEDLIAAEGIDDATLRNLANNGNDKAGFLFHDRYLNRLGDRHETQLDLSNPSDQALASALDADDIIFLTSSSPFKGYVEAADAFSVYADPVEQKARLVSGLVRAGQLGDSRAAETLFEYVGRGMISDEEYAIATQIYVDSNMDRNLIPGAKCPNFTNFGPMPVK